MILMKEGSIVDGEPVEATINGDNVNLLDKRI
jgi:hypothetical protein